MRFTCRRRDIVRLSLVIIIFLIASPLLAAPTDADLTWGSDGELLAKHPSIHDQFLQMDGKLVTVNGTKIVRYRTTSAVDPTFGVNGVVNLETMISLENIHVITGALQSDDKILLAGRVGDGYEGLGLVTRLHGNGTLDTTFGDNGIVTFDPDTIEDSETESSYTIFITKIAQQPNGRIVISGTDITRFILIRLMPDGTFDDSLDGNGVLYIRPNPALINSYGEFHIQADGKLLTVSFSFSDHPSSLPNEVRISRFNSDGTPDTGFNANNPILFNDPEPKMFAVETQLDGVHHDGAFIFALIENVADDEHQLRLVKYDADGIVNPLFGEKVFPLPSVVDYHVPFLRLVDDSKMLFGVSFGFEDNYLYLMQFNNDGELDATFGTNGIFDTRTDYGWQAQLNGLEVQRDGKLIFTSETTIGRYSGNTAFSYSGLFPTHRTTDVPVNSNLTVMFTEPVTINTGIIEIRRMSDASLFERIPVTDIAQVSGHGTTMITINPTNDFEPNTGYFVLASPDTFTDTSDYPFSGVRELIEWHFTTGNLIINTAPEMTVIGGKSVEAGQTLSFTATATDTENNALIFSLDDGDAGSVPTGATITTGGEFLWTPSEAQVGQHSFDVVVTDDGEPNLSDFETITVTVTEPPFVNTAPTLAEIGNKTVEAGQILEFVGSATDPDTTIGQILTFSLDDGDTGSVPTGAVITTLGEFTWTPNEAQIGEHTFDVVVTDDGEPNLNDFETITVTVTTPPVEPPTELLTNRGFENKSPNNPKRAAKWTVSKLVSSDGRVCNKTKPPTVYAHAGKCAFQFSLNTAKARYIEQKVTLTEALEGQTMRVAGYVKRNGLTAGAAIQVQITYVDNSKATLKIVILGGTKGYKLLENTLVLEQDAKKARIRITTGKSKGRFLVDSLSLTVSEASTLSLQGQPLPLPAAPDLRGH